jgi:hypothetical protein
MGRLMFFAKVIIIYKIILNPVLDAYLRHLILTKAYVVFLTMKIFFKRIAFIVESK